MSPCYTINKIIFNKDLQTQRIGKHNGTIEPGNTALTNKLIQLVVTAGLKPRTAGLRVRESVGLARKLRIFLKSLHNVWNFKMNLATF